MKKSSLLHGFLRELQFKTVEKVVLAKVKLFSTKIVPY